MKSTTFKRFEQRERKTKEKQKVTEGASIQIHGSTQKYKLIV